jgi:hypothetical protein
VKHRRRHRNPSISGDLDIGMLLAVGVGGYLLYQFLSSSGAISAVSAAGGAVTSAAASLFPGTSPSVIPQGTLLLPGGGSVPVASLQSNGFNSDGSLSMTDASGNNYSVTSIGNGIYQAQ